MIESKGTVRIYEVGSKARNKTVNRGGTIQIDADWGIVLLYTKFIKESLGLDKLNSPRQGSHITIIDNKIHKNVRLSGAKHWNNRRVTFRYDPNIVEGGRAGVFRNFYLKVECEEINKIKKELGVVDSPRFLGSHLTIGNTKGL